MVRLLPRFRQNNSWPKWLFLLLAFNSCQLQAAELSVKLNETTVEMGKYLLAEIRYQGEKVTGEFNLTEWQQAFYVDWQESETEQLNDKLQQKTSRVRLYPRRTGTLALPSIAYGGAIAAAGEIKVKPSIRQGIDATPVMQPLQAYYWSDQAIRLQLDVALHDKRNIVEADDFEIPAGFTLYSLKPQRIRSEAVDVIRLEWMLYTPNQGRYLIELPAIHQRGRGRFRYHLPSVQLYIKPLPAYLPVTLPVGRVEIRSEIINTSKSSALLQLDIQKTGRLPEHIEGLASWFKSLEIDPLDVVIENERDRSNAVASRIYRIPLPDWYFASSEKISIPYFNTVKGKLEYHQHILPEFWQVPDYISKTLIFVIMLAVFLVGYRLNRLAENIRLWKSLHRQIMQSVSAHQLRKLLLKNQPARNLTEWSRRYQGANSASIEKELNALCFQQNSLIELQRIKKRCMQYYSFNLEKSPGSRKST